MHAQDPSPLARLELTPPRLVSFRAACAHMKSRAAVPAGPQQPPAPAGGYSTISQLLQPAHHGLEAEVERLQAQVCFTLACISLCLRLLSGDWVSTEQWFQYEGLLGRCRKMPSASQDVGMTAASTVHVLGHAPSQWGARAAGPWMVSTYQLSPCVAAFGP